MLAPWGCVVSPVTDIDVREAICAIAFSHLQPNLDTDGRAAMTKSRYSLRQTSGTLAELIGATKD